MRLGAISGILFTLAAALVAQAAQAQDPLTKGILYALAAICFIVGAYLERQGLAKKEDIEELKRRIRELQNLRVK